MLKHHLTYQPYQRIVEMSTKSIDISIEKVKDDTLKSAMSYCRPFIQINIEYSVARLTNPIKLDSYFPFLLRSISSRIAVGTSNMVVGSYNIGMREWRIIALLADRGRLTNKEIVHASGMDKASVSRGLNGLLKQTLVQQTAAPKGDLRTKPYALSVQGISVYNEISDNKISRMEKLWSSFTNSEKKELIRLLQKLKVNVFEVLDDNEE